MARVLVLEDDPDFSALLSDSLQRMGHDAYMFSNVSDAIDAFEKEAFDAVVADLIIFDPDQSAAEGGLVFIWRVREISTLKNIKVPVIAISGSVHHAGMQHALDTARHLGADHVLAKPFAPNELKDCIEFVIEEARKT